MDIQLTWEDERRLLITCSGDIGWDDRDELVKKIRNAVGEKQEPHLVMDLEAVDFVNSAGLGALIQVLKFLGEREGKLVMAKVPPNLLNLFTTVRFDRLIHFADTLEEARTFLAEEG